MRWWGWGGGGGGGGGRALPDRSVAKPNAPLQFRAENQFVVWTLEPCVFTSKETEEIW